MHEHCSKAGVVAHVHNNHARSSTLAATKSNVKGRRGGCSATVAMTLSLSTSASQPTTTPHSIRRHRALT